MVDPFTKLLDLDDTSKSVHEFKGSLGIVKMLADHLMNEMTPDEHTLKILEIFIEIMDRNIELFDLKIIKL